MTIRKATNSRAEMTTRAKTTRRPIGVRDLDLEFLQQFFGNRLLKPEELGCRPFETFRPELAFGLGIDQRDIHANVAGEQQDGSIDDVPGTKKRRHVLEIDGSLCVVK